MRASKKHIIPCCPFLSVPVFLHEVFIFFKLLSKCSVTSYFIAAFFIDESVALMKVFFHLCGEQSKGH